MISAAVGLWAAVWKRVAPRARLPDSRLVVTPFASDAPMRAMIGWRPDWKTEAIAAVLQHRRGGLIDVGANVGQSLLDFLSAQVRSTYIGFEPNLTCYQHLAAFIAANRLENCRLIPAALGERNRISALYRIGGDVDSGATTVEGLRPRSQVRSEPCCVFRLDDLTELLTEPETALIKIDVEGGELEALRGMESFLRARKPWVLCEVLHRDPLAEAQAYRSRCAELMSFVRDLGYDVQRIVQDDAGQKVRGLESVIQFPDVVWNEDESMRLCDYLFSPVPDIAEARAVLVA